jgi:hypothetical protein
MKARHIRKLRKELQSYKTFRVVGSYGAFGEFFLQQDWEYKKIKAKSPVHAINRYMKWFFRHFKQRSRHQKEWYQETSFNWGEIQVIDEKGYARYYH